MGLTLKEKLDVFTALAVLVGGLFALTKWIHELREQRALRERELRWRQAEAGKRLLDELEASGKAQAALGMLDWDGIEYEIAPGKSAEIWESDYLKALRIWPLNFDDKEVFIRNAFDELFGHMAVCEHHLQAQLVLFEDIRFPYDYYVPTLNRNQTVFEEFLDFYQLHLARQFLGRLNKALGSRAAARPSWEKLAKNHKSGRTP